LPGTPCASTAGAAAMRAAAESAMIAAFIFQSSLAPRNKKARATGLKLDPFR
jgi:hypothetical protein